MVSAGCGGGVRCAGECSEPKRRGKRGDWGEGDKTEKKLTVQ